MSVLVNILVAILGLTLVFGGLVGWLVKLFLSQKKSVDHSNHTIIKKDRNGASCDGRKS